MNAQDKEILASVAAKVQPVGEAVKEITVFTPKGKPVKVRRLGLTVTFTTKRGKTAVKLEESNK